MAQMERLENNEAGRCNVVDLVSIATAEYISLHILCTFHTRMVTMYHVTPFQESSDD